MSYEEMGLRDWDADSHALTEAIPFGGLGMSCLSLFIVHLRVLGSAGESDNEVRS